MKTIFYLDKKKRLNYLILEIIKSYNRLIFKLNKAFLLIIKYFIQQSKV